MMMGVSRERRAAAIGRELRIGSETAVGSRAVRWRGIDIGLLRHRDGFWILHWRIDGSDHWRPYYEELHRASSEVAEAWALDSLARVLAIVGRGA